MMESSRNDKLRKLLMRHEGLRLRAYKCTAGKTTVGYGRNLDDVGVSEFEANFLLSNDIARTLQSCVDAFAWFNSIGLVRQDVIASLVFQLGLEGFETFKNVIAAMRAQDYAKAADEMENSLWFKQTPSRARELVQMMRDGRYAQ
jgi:lysozyme